jgi:hypothetical protein
MPKLFPEWSGHDLFLLRLLVGSESLRNRSWTTSGDHAELVGVMGVESVCVVFIIKQSTTEKLSALAAPKSSCLCFVSPIQCFLAGVHQQSSQQVVSELRSVLGNVFSGGFRWVKNATRTRALQWTSYLTVATTTSWTHQQPGGRGAPARHQGCQRVHELADAHTIELRRLIGAEEGHALG